MSLTLVEVCTTFSADDRCRELLERLRWPEGPLCLRCGGIEAHDDLRSRLKAAQPHEVRALRSLLRASETRILQELASAWNQPLPEGSCTIDQPNFYLAYIEEP